jgi:hypothetical protein
MGFQEVFGNQQLAARFFANYSSLATFPAVSPQA